MTVEWQGVFPAATTQFASDAAVDLEATTAHLERLIRAGVHGLVMLGTVGENCSLSAEEKRSVVAAAVKTAAGRVPVIAGVAETTTRAACNYAADVEALRSEEHTSELQSLMRISYAVFCLKKKKHNNIENHADYNEHQ